MMLGGFVGLRTTFDRVNLYAQYTGGNISGYRDDGGGDSFKGREFGVSYKIDDRVSAVVGVED